MVGCVKLQLAAVFNTHACQCSRLSSDEVHSETRQAHSVTRILASIEESGEWVVNIAVCIISQLRLFQLQLHGVYTPSTAFHPFPSTHVLSCLAIIQCTTLPPLLGTLTILVEPFMSLAFFLCLSLPFGFPPLYDCMLTDSALWIEVL